MLQESTRQTLAFFSALLLALSAGTNYAFSIFSVQLGQRLDLTATEINIVGLAGNVGMYVSSPPIGRLVDRYNPTMPLLAALTLISSGYMLVWFIYEHPTLVILRGILPLGNLAIGVGSSIANSCAVAGIASVIPPAHRASAIGIVLAGFGLSAFFWTTLGALIAQADTAQLLALLSIGPSLMILLGASGYLSVGLARNASTRLAENIHSLPPNSSASPSGNESSRLLPNQKKKTDLSGWALVKEIDFWMIWIFMSCCCGIALMIINNLGSIISALSRYNHTHQSPKDIRQYQAHAVSVLSIFNCLGRMFAGTVSDLMKRHVSLGRVWWLSWISVVMMTSQVLGYYVVEDVVGVGWLAGLVGFGYGNVYGIAPVLMLEWFGLRHFAANFGYLNLSPLVSGQIFNLSFGTIFDRHSHRLPDNPGLVCDVGKACYQAAFLLTLAASLLALALSVALARRRPEFLRPEFPNPTPDDHEARVPMLSGPPDDC